MGANMAGCCICCGRQGDGDDSDVVLAALLLRVCQQRLRHRLRRPARVCMRRKRHLRNVCFISAA